MSADTVSTFPMEAPPSAIQVLINPGLDRHKPYSPAEQAILSLAQARQAWRTIAQWPGYQATPLHTVDQLGQQTGVDRLMIKDESARFELASFKALGGAYAVQCIARQYANTRLTVTCATDGNHGRAVAWGARSVGARAVIFVHETVSEGRAAAIAGFGAEVRREGRTYDDAVRRCAETAAREGWHVVSDTSWPGYEDIPRQVMQGYAVLAAEIEAVESAPTHVFVPGGVGGLAAGVLSWYWERHGARRPILVVVEPDQAACLYESALAGEPRTFPGGLDTLMAGLACGEPSLLAWRILSPGADAFVTINDAAAVHAMRTLADHGIVSGESGAAALAAFMGVAANPKLRELLALTGDSRVVCLSTEGATDPVIYRQLVGRDAGAVQRGISS